MIPKIFYLSQTPLNKQSGATLAMRRHFLEHGDVEVFVATSEEINESESKCLKISRPSWLARAGRTRFARLIRNFEILVHAGILQPDVIAAAEEFQPDAIFTVADMTQSQQALALAKRLGVPLISNFQDWWPRGQFYLDLEKPYSFLVPLLERRFRKLHEASDLVFCTSEGMKEFLGDHPNSHVLYPIGAQEVEDEGEQPALPAKREGQPKRLLYTGTAFGSYGRMLLELSEMIESLPEWELVIFGAKPDWPAEKLEKAEASGLYRGFIPFEKLKNELRAADACLSVMSFEPELEVMMQTSFTTKVLDYCSAGRPVIMWGPDFCSPVKLTKKEGAGLTVENPDPAGVLACLEQLSANPELEDEMGKAALRLANKDLSHQEIHRVFVREIRRLTKMDGQSDTGE